MFRLHAKWKTKQWKLWLKITFSIIKNEGLGCRGTDISSWYCRDDSIEEIENITNAFVAVLVISNIFNFLFSPLSANGFSKSMVKTLQKCSWTSMKPETSLRPYQTSTIDFFCENFEQVLHVLLFSWRTPSHMFDRVLYTPLLTTKRIINYGKYLKVDYCTVRRHLELLESTKQTKVCSKYAQKKNPS